MPSFDIIEALLEMHFHRALVECFSWVFSVRLLSMQKLYCKREPLIGFNKFGTDML